MYLGLHVKCCYSRQILMKVDFSMYVFAKHSDIKFHENAFIELRSFPFGRTDVTKLIVAFRNLRRRPNCDLEVNGNRMRLLLIKISYHLIP
jgi:hypothetical protein